MHTIDAALVSNRITQPDADLINEFIAERKVAANIGASRANKFIYVLFGWRRFIGPYHDLSVADIYTSIDTMKNSLTEKGHHSNRTRSTKGPGFSGIHLTDADKGSESLFNREKP